MLARRFVFNAIVIIGLIFNLLPLPTLAAPLRQSNTVRADAVVLVNSTSPDYLDFQHFIQPYLDHFGVPYTVINIAVTPIGATIDEYAVIIIGHRQLDPTGAYLDADEQGYLTSAVNAGTGLVNFDNDLSGDSSLARYAFIQSIFAFGYSAATTGSNVSFSATSHYITQQHTPGESISTGDMTLAGITLPGSVTALATSDAQPFLAVTTHGQGKAVQFSSYDWMSHAVKGPLFGLDDLVWRGLVWAARKPFVMRGLPPFATMRMDDTTGPLDWVHAASDYGFKPWLGIFPENMQAATITDLKGLVDDGKATTAIHAWASDTSHFFYFDHNHGQDYSDTTMAANFTNGSAWFASNNIPMSTYLVPHYYEIGSNALTGVENWGIQYIGTMMNPGQLEASAPWMTAGPFRLYEDGSAYDRSHNAYYADFVPGTDNKLFNCITELRDITGYEWLGTSGHTSVAAGIADGTTWLSRSFDDMVLGTLFSHEYAFVPSMSMTDWRTIMAGITQNIAGYNPQYVTMDYACQYVRALKTSHITGASYNPDSETVTVNFAGKADLTTQYYIFNEAGGVPQQILVNGASAVSAFDNGTTTAFTIPGALDHIAVTPNTATVVAGTSRQFTAQGYDADNNPIPSLTYTWSVAHGGGTINTAGLFTAGTTAGHFASTVVASVGSVSGLATVDVTTPPVDHFTIDAIASPQYVEVPFRMTITARDADGNIVVNYTGQAALSSSVGTLDPTTTASFNSGRWSGTVTIDQVATGATISAIDDTHTGTSNSFNTLLMRSCPCSIWDDSAVPANASVSDDQPIEVGVKFRTEVDGYVMGVRFYKGTLNTGTHIGHLWTTSGAQLAEATFVGESSSGWQQVLFDAPVQVSAGTTYIASYHSPSYFANTESNLTTAVSNPPLRALANSEDGPNAVFKYGPNPAFPDQSWNASNYWVDVIFTTQVGPDTMPPQVLSVLPANGVTGVSINTAVNATFNEAIDPATISNNTFELRDAANVLVPATVAYNAAARTATLTSQSALAYSTGYHATIISGASGVKDLAGNALATDYAWTFTTAASPAPPPDEGFGGPILVVADANSSNPFGRYYAEILRAEGFNAFSVTDISTVNASVLDNYDVVILGEMSLTADQITLLNNWVSAGGNLIAMRPDQGLAARFGLSDATGTTSEGYVLVDTSTPIGTGIVAETLQFHGAADHYALNGATSLATLYSDASTSTVYPAIARYTSGSGHVVIFTYDLARSVVLMRQGNPAWAGQEGDGENGIRATDMFVGRSGQPNWIDNTKLLIPQADEQMHLLSHAIEQLNVSRRPLPRLWYFPDRDKGALIMTGDSEGCSGSCVNVPMQDVNSYGGHYTAYLLGTQPSSSEVNGWLANGNGVAPHYDDTGEAGNPTVAGMSGVYDAMTQAHIAAYGVSPRTVRNHWILWTGWSDQAAIEEAHGIRLDTNYYHWGSWLNGPGYFTGSGLPLRFADENGHIIDVYQATTQLPDETWGQNIDTTFRTLIDRSLDQGYYGFLTANFHPPNYGSYQAVAENLMAYANGRGVPIWSAENLLDFLQARNQVHINTTAWDGTQLTFSVDQLIGGQHLTLMIPAAAGGYNLQSIEFGGSPIAFTLETIKGYTYALVATNTGSYQATYAPDTTPPTVVAVSPVATATGVAVTSVIAADFNEAIDTQTLNTNSFELRDAASNLVPANISYDAGTRTATLTPATALNLNTPYTARLRGGPGGVSDLAGNPLAADFVWSFTTSVSLFNCPCSIWSDTSIPGTLAVDDANPYDLGVKFRSSVAGYITGIRFYKGATNTGPFTAHLWASDGTLLATGTFDHVTSTGWQQATFATPVAINANTTYIASYFTQSGNYAFDGGYFATSDVTNPPLRALQEGEDGPNAVYRVGGGFPNQSYISSNYWVDVVFDTTLPADTTPPVVSAVTATPGPGNTAILAWTTDEPATTRVDYGILPDALTSQVSQLAPITAHIIALTGLTANTTYYYRVTSIDGANNSSTYPSVSDSPLSFTLPAARFVDTTVNDFGAGTMDACYLGQDEDGELLLNPTLGEEFSGATLPTGWTTYPWTGGAVTSSGGQLIADGAAGFTDASYSPGRSLEFVATFGAAPNQHIGWVADQNFTAPWILFSTYTLRCRALCSGQLGWH